MRTARVDGYTNIYELLPDEPAVYGTETLYGDWAGALLVLAQDFTTDANMRGRIAAGDPTPYHHTPTLDTNLRLAQLISGSGYTGGVLYGSALAGLLKHQQNRGDKLTNQRAARQYGGRVLRFVIDNMPNLAAVACLGSVAWDCACEELYDAKPHPAWQPQLGADPPLTVDVDERRIALFSMSHTSRRGTLNRIRGTGLGLEVREARVREDWEILRADLAAAV